ncbi:MAG: hypothetical protein HY077_10920 [Elusimicrobia bacterium]|nr:hypothetical protein [Elusimicrobiota bacterium]
MPPDSGPIITVIGSVAVALIQTFAKPGRGRNICTVFAAGLIIGGLGVWWFLRDPDLSIRVRAKNDPDRTEFYTKEALDFTVLPDSVFPEVIHWIVDDAQISEVHGKRSLTHTFADDGGSEHLVNAICKINGHYRVTSKIVTTRSLAEWNPQTVISRDGLTSVAPRRFRGYELAGVTLFGDSEEPHRNWEVALAAHHSIIPQAVRPLLADNAEYRLDSANFALAREQLSQAGGEASLIYSFSGESRKTIRLAIPLLQQPRVHNPGDKTAIFPEPKGNGS